MHYYFFNNSNRILFSETEIEVEKFPNITPLTEEQSSWYETHSTAKAHEVRALMMDADRPKPQPYVAPEPPLIEQKLDYIAKLKKQGEQMLERLVPYKDVVNALSYSILEDEPTLRNTSVIAKYKKYRECIRKEMGRIAWMINAATNKDEIMEAYSHQRLWRIKTGEEDFSVQPEDEPIEEPAEETEEEQPNTEE